MNEKLPFLAAGALGMIVLGTIEIWAERADIFREGDEVILFLVLLASPVVVMITAWLLVQARLTERGTPALHAGGRIRTAALAGWALLSMAVVCIAQAIMFGASSALVGYIGCGTGGNDWCGLASGVFGAVAVGVGGTLGLVGSALWAATRRRAGRS